MSITKSIRFDDLSFDDSRLTDVVRGMLSTIQYASAIRCTTVIRDDHTDVCDMV
jgi:hypothetical protein